MTCNCIGVNFKKEILGFSTKTILLLVLVIVPAACFATNYTSTGDGDYSDPVWSAQAPNPILAGDNVFINHAITLDAELNIRGVIYIGVNGSILGNEKLDND